MFKSVSPSDEAGTPKVASMRGNLLRFAGERVDFVVACEHSSASRVEVEPAMGRTLLRGRLITESASNRPS
ncbi:MAG TPA: hypothetical protein VIM99_08605 [Blastocatellia bacterium]